LFTLRRRLLKGQIGIILRGVRGRVFHVPLGRSGCEKQADLPKTHEERWRRTKAACQTVRRVAQRCAAATAGNLRCWRRSGRRTNG
jgi:hypothetical protein